MCFRITLLLLGLFGSLRGSPLSSKISDDLNDIDYILFVKDENPFEFKIDVDPLKLLDHGFNPEHPTKILVHGWVVSGYGFAQEFAEAYHQTGDFNVIGIDWDRLATIENYLGAAINSNRVGDHVGQYLVVNTLMNALGQSPGKIQAIGHSLGAHAVGHIGRTARAASGSNIARVTGNISFFRVKILFKESRNA